MIDHDRASISDNVFMCSWCQVKEGSEGSGAIESVMRVVRRTVR